MTGSAGSTGSTRRRLPDEVASHHVCLGIFGTTAKAQRVVPNKVLQGAAAGCAILTSDTAAQRDALGDGAVYVPAGSPGALAEELAALVTDRQRLDEQRQQARAIAASRLTPSGLRRTAARDHRSAAPVCKGEGVTLPPLSPNAWLRWELIRRELSALQPHSILELGMGQGALGARLEHDRRYVGIEPDDRSRAVAKDRLSSAATVLADLAELPATETVRPRLRLRGARAHRGRRGLRCEQWASHVRG